MRRVLSLAFLFPFLCHISYAAAPILQSGTLVNSNGNPLKVDHYSSPEVADWNSDGKKDLLVGAFTNGEIFVYLNQGTDAAPVFGTAQKLQSGGSAIRVGYF